MVQRRHTDRSFDDELRRLREQLLLMAGRVEQMIAHAMRALAERDPELARRTIKADNLVNRMEIETDDLCLGILARRQPMASDLRFITLALKMVTDLERIGDLAVNISERAVQLAGETNIERLDTLLRMSELVQSMIHDAIEAFVERDAEKALGAITTDDELDELYHQVFRDLLARMERGESEVERAIHVQSVAKWLERIGDHATNLAELVVFLVHGKDIRHEGKLGEWPDRR